LISKHGYPCKDIPLWISINNKYPYMDIHAFMDISLQLPVLLWISIWISLDFYGYPCIDCYGFSIQGNPLHMQIYALKKESKKIF